MTARTLLPALLLCLVPQLAPAQTPVSVFGTDDELQRDRRFWEEMRQAIEDKRHLYIPGPGGGVIISREQEADLFGTLILTAQLSPDSIVSMHNKLKSSTGIFLATVKQSLKALDDELWRRSQAPPGIVVNDFRGTVSGRWNVACWRDGIPLNEGGTFSLRLVGDGTVSGTYVGPSGSFGVGGKIDDAGNIDGGGTHPDGTFHYLARVRTNSFQAFLLGGTVQFVPRDPETSCAGGELTPAGAS
ncbi:MAG: hypothetical protein ABR559_04755 [Gemmatimonadota bacterium]